jgi:hypothetical protein
MGKRYFKSKAIAADLMENGREVMRAAISEPD